MPKPLFPGPWRYDLQDQLFRSILYGDMEGREADLVDMMLLGVAQEGRWVDGAQVSDAISTAKEVMRIADN